MFKTRVHDTPLEARQTVHEMYMAPDFIPQTSIRKGLSTVPRAGMGIFSNERLRKHAVVGEYTGRICKQADCNKEWSMFSSRGPDFMIDASTSRRTCMVRFINCASPNLANCIHRELYADGRVFIVTKHSIPADSELFFYYGGAYPYPKHPDRF
jgi:hypothetical protein